MNVLTRQIGTSPFVSVPKGICTAAQPLALLDPQLLAHQPIADVGNVRDFVEIEPYGKRNQKPPPARMYVIRIDKVKHSIDAAGLTARQLLELAGKRPVDRYAIFLRLNGGHSVFLPPDAVIDFMIGGLERLMTLPLDQTEGSW